MTLIEAVFRCLLALGLLTLNALLVSCELSLIQLRASSFKKQWLERLQADERLNVLLDKGVIDTTLRTARLGAIACTLGYGLVFYTLALNGLTQWSVLQGGLGLIASHGLALVAILFGHFAVSGLPASIWASQAPLDALRVSFPVARVMGRVAQPLLVVSLPLAWTRLKRFRIDPDAVPVNQSLDSEVDALIQDSPEPESRLHNILKRTLEMSRLNVKDVLLPRNQVQYLDLTQDNASNIALARTTRHTRFPLCKGDLDNCVGLIHIKDIFLQADAPECVDLRGVCRKMLRFQPDDSLADALDRLLRTRAHMALVVDEFGGSIGVLTLERILETLVGDIKDEFDIEEVLIRPLKGNAYWVAGLTPLHDLEETFGISVEHEEVSTLSGLITAELGRIPKAQESLAIGGLRIAIIEADETRVIATEVQPEASDFPEEQP